MATFSWLLAVTVCVASVLGAAGLHSGRPESSPGIQGTVQWPGRRSSVVESPGSHMARLLRLEDMYTTILQTKSGLDVAIDFAVYLWNSVSDEFKIFPVRSYVFAIVYVCNDILNTYVKIPATGFHCRSSSARMVPARRSTSIQMVNVITKNCVPEGDGRMLWILCSIMIKCLRLIEWILHLINCIIP